MIQVCKIQLLVLLLCLTSFTSCLFNPGILISVPFPQQPPHADLKLPLSIDPILINDLQLSQIAITQVQYTWNFTEQSVSVSISNAAVLFDWKFRSDSGQGTFQESQYQIDLQYKFVQNAKNRLQVSVVSSKSKLGHSSVHLGGTTKQTVIVEVTNLIMNHAAIVFRKAIEKAISGAVESFSSIFEHDPKIFCESSKSHCVYLNSTLVSPPIISNKTLVIQLNGASYITGEQSGELNPQTVLIKTGSSKIEAQIHTKAIEEIVSKVIRLIPQSYELDVASKFGTFDLNTLLVTPLFPMMSKFDKLRAFNVLLSNIKVNSSLNQTLQTIGAAVQFQINADTKNPSTQKYEKYLPNDCKVTVSEGLQIIYGWKGVSLRISNLKMESIQCNQKDIQDGYVNPQAVINVKDTMFTLLRTGINGEINKKVVVLQFSGIQALLSGKILKQKMMFDVAFSSTNQSSQNQEKSSFKVLLDQ